MNAFGNPSVQPEPAVAAASTDWGLSFQSEGAAPIGNATAAELSAYNAYYVGDTSKKVIYLTFDAGFENGNTPAILDALKKHNAPACFFLVGNYIETAPELGKLEDAYQSLIGKPLPKLYRPPQGKYSAENLQQAQSLGYTSVFWSLAYVDWYTDNQPTAEQAFSKLLPRIHPGAIVLLHSTSSTNASILDELLTKWESSGYTFGSLTDLQKSL